MIYANGADYHDGNPPALNVPRKDKRAILDAMKSCEPKAMAAGYITDYSTGAIVTTVVGALYEKNGARWSREEVWNLEHNDMEVSDEFADALLGRSRR
jgi:hypothetical protein